MRRRRFRADDKEEAAEDDKKAQASVEGSSGAKRRESLPLLHAIFIFDYPQDKDNTRNPHFVSFCCGKK